jgi:hypothetical protein
MIKTVLKIIGLSMAMASVVMLTFLVMAFFVYPDASIEVYEYNRVISGLEIVLGINAIWILGGILWRELAEIKKRIKRSIK